MILIEWNSTYSVGLEEIDKQHKVLVDLINKLYDAVLQKKEREILGTILNELVLYTKTHFTVEESLMSILHYPELKSHKMAHDKLIEKLNEFGTEFSSNRTDISAELLEFLKTWLIQHIRKTDIDYADYFKSNIERAIDNSKYQDDDEDDDDESNKSNGFFSWLLK